MGQIMEDISEHYHGTGGGHAGTAGIDVVADMDKILSQCKKRVREILMTKKTDESVNFDVSL